MIGEDAITKEKTQLSRRGNLVVGEELESSEELFTRLRQQDSRFKGNMRKSRCEEETQGLQLYIMTWADLKQSIARMLEEIRRSDDQDFYLP
ncbi:hypothetical protein V6N11_034217 [Hibiscus sabdariffa]|uniref:Uncharacterized protein n=2 Tax=Hibiscus sabdariffa TaxID=183260 RepID=A0ABR2BHQ7_9ROSI